MIQMYSGTVGSGKSYHALEDIVQMLSKGKYVIANFPLTFSPGQIKKGFADRFMYFPDDLIMGTTGYTGVLMLTRISRQMGWDERDEEGLCLLVVDESTNFFPKEDSAKPEQKVWRKWMTQSRKLGYDVTLILQDENSINKTIKKCVEYEVKHRKINNVFPFKYFPITIFMYIKYWCQQRTRLSSQSSIFVKRFAKMYNTKRIFADLDGELQGLVDTSDPDFVMPAFGNCLPDREAVGGGDPEGGGADDGVQSGEAECEEEERQTA